MLVRAAQRAGLSGLQRAAVRLQVLNAPLLRQQLLLVADFFVLCLVPAAQADKIRSLLLHALVAFLQIGVQLLLLLVQGIALAGLLLQLQDELHLLLRSLPAGTQLSQAAAMGSQQSLLSRVGLFGSALGLLQCGLRLLHHGGLCTALLLQGLSLILGVLQLGLRALQLLLVLLALFQLFAPAAQLFAELGMGGMLLLPFDQIGLLRLQVMRKQLCFLV